MAMTVLIYRYGSICEPDIISTLQELNIQIIEENCEMYNKTLSPKECVTILSSKIQEYHPLFVFSINFFPAVAEVCHLFSIPYICWTVDCPVTELFSTSILHKTNHIFMFDKAQYEYFSPFNENIHHLPLAANTQRFDQVISTITQTDIQQYTSDISFVGSLYIEKNPMHKIRLSKYNSGYVSAVSDSTLKVYGANFIEELMTDSLIQELSHADNHFLPSFKTITDPSAYLAAHCYIGIQISEQERITTLNKLAENFAVTLYTRSDVSSLHRVNVRGGIKTLTEMPKVFHLSKINLNMTIKPIQSGLPLRIFDIMGCGGFLMTNYQPELTDYFEIGKDLEAYTSLEELCDKCAFYLEHPDIREQIAKNGYEKIKNFHTYLQRIAKMLSAITEF